MRALNKERIEHKTSEDNVVRNSRAQKFNWIKIGIPVLLLQMVMAYFLASYMIVPAFLDTARASDNSPSKSGAPIIARKQTTAYNDAEFGIIHQLEDLVVNPAESRGNQFILINVALEVQSRKDVKILKKRNVQVRDILIRLLSSKTLPELDGPTDKEKLRKEIKENISVLLPEGHLRNVYFSNYLIQ